MGCFSYHCQKCGRPIREKEGVKLFVLQNGKVLEEMQGNYNLYGHTNENDWKADWSDICDLHFNSNSLDGVAAIHTDCYKDETDTPSECSSDDENQGSGHMQTKQTRTFFHKIYDKIAASVPNPERDNELEDLNQRTVKLLEDISKILEEYKNKSDNP
jgi:hypothetical protein